MARLFGLISKEEVNFNIKIEDLGKNSTGKIHGWGIGGYDKLRKIQVQKGKRSSVSIEQNSKINASLKSDIIIAHARVATTGFVNEQNVHPFFYKKYLFAHNGTINKDKIIPQLKKPYNLAYQSEPIDSELLFRLLIQSIETKKEVLAGLEQAVKLVKDVRGTNFILSDGKKLFAYCFGKPLFYLRRKPFPFLAVSKETGITYECNGLSLRDAFLISSERLTDENWIRFDEDELVVCDRFLNYDTYRFL